MTHKAEEYGTTLERFRAYLRLLAGMQMDPRLQGKLDASDLVQQTLLQALQALDRFQQRSEAELAVWLTRSPVLIRLALHPVPIGMV